MPDELISLDGCYHDGGKPEFDRNSVPGLRKALDKCHDVNKRLIRANDVLRERSMRQWLWIKVLSAATAGAWALVVGLIVFIASNW